MLRITFDSDEILEGENETELLDEWNDLPAWRSYTPGEFRDRLVDFVGADVDGGMPSSDDLILPAVLEMAIDAHLERVSPGMRASKL